MKKSYFKPSALRRQLDRRGLSSATVAKYVQVTDITVRCWLRGEREPRVTNLVRLCKMLRIDVYELLTVTKTKLVNARV